MSNSLKQDIINVVGKDKYIQCCKEIKQLYDEAENGVCSNTNDSIMTRAIKNFKYAGKLSYKETNKDHVLVEDIDDIINPNTQQKLSLYNVQFTLLETNKLINKFVFAWDEFNAKEIITKPYHDFKYMWNEVYCQKVDIKYGMTFN